MEELEKLAKLIRAKNKIDDKIAEIIGRPSSIGNLGEYLASKIFNIKLNQSATKKCFDGYFTQKPLQGQTVNIKFYTKRNNTLDINLNCLSDPDYYIVITGPKTGSGSSRGTTEPFVITKVYLFNSQKLIHELNNCRVKIGTATSVYSKLWEEAEIYPKKSNNIISLSKEQVEQLRLFGEF